MNEEMNVVEVAEVETTEVCPIDVESYEGSSLSRNQWIALGVGGALLTGGVSLLIANRKKIKNWINDQRIKKLEGEGYTVLPCGNKNSEVVVKTEEETK